MPDLRDSPGWIGAILKSAADELTGTGRAWEETGNRETGGTG